MTEPHMDHAFGTGELKQVDDFSSKGKLNPQ